MLAKGYFLPDKKSRILTVEFMSNVRSGHCACPMFEDVRLLPCNKPPTAPALQAELCTGIGYMCHEWANSTDQDDNFRVPAWEVLKAYLLKSPANKSWLLACMSTFFSGHDMFKSGFEPVKKLTHQRMVNNDDGFFKDLPKPNPS